MVLSVCRKKLHLLVIEPQIQKEKKIVKIIVVDFLALFTRCGLERGEGRPHLRARRAIRQNTDHGQDQGRRDDINALEPYHTTVGGRCYATYCIAIILPDGRFFIDNRYP